MSLQELLHHLQGLQPNLHEQLHHNIHLQLQHNLQVRQREVVAHLEAEVHLEVAEDDNHFSTNTTYVPFFEA